MSLNLDTDLYQYQKEDSLRMLGEGNWLNFSEMGVGKTPEALNLIEKGGFKHPLIVCPNSLKLEWKRQIEVWVGEGRTALSSTIPGRRMEDILYSLVDPNRRVIYKIVNYEVFRVPSMVEFLGDIKFDVIVFDEVHKLRNPETKQTKGVWKFLESKKEAKILCLSGSPIMNYPNDLYVPLSIVKPGMFPRTLRGWREFMDIYCLWSGGRYGNYIYGSRNTEYLKKMISPWVVRRTKKEVLPFLPDKVYRRVILEMEGDQRKLYKQMEEELAILLDSGEPLWSTSVLSTLTRLRQINLDPKILGVSSPSAKTDFLVELIEGTDEKIVVFSCFEKYIYLLSLMYPETSITLTGEVKTEERAERVKRFQEDPKLKLCLGTIQTMGEGLTLTAASNVVMVDRWWNEPTNQQAIDRLHRIGQKNSVQVIYPICENSIDDFLDSILETKSGLSGEYFPENLVRNMILERHRKGDKTPQNS